MKKIIALCALGLLLAACSDTPGELKPYKIHSKKYNQKNALASVSAPLAPCLINGHACWEVVQKTKNTKQIELPAPKTQETPDTWFEPVKYRYENPELKAWGLDVTFYTLYRDGGSTTYILNDAIYIHTNRAINHPLQGYVTIKFKDGTYYLFDPAGNVQNADLVFP